MHIDWLRAQTETFAEAVTGLDGNKQVVTCPEWSVRALVAHVGHAHRQTANIIRTGQPEQFLDPLTADVPQDWGPWLRAGAEELADAVIQAGDKKVWTLIGSLPASFWLRRMLHETVIHSFDAAVTAGIAYRIHADVAVDGIEEGLQMVSIPDAGKIRPHFANLRGTGQTLRLRANGNAWLITRNPDGVAWQRSDDDADVTVSASAQDLLLLFYGRLGIDDVTVTGDRDLISHWLVNTAL
ncbi:maleylpyruvate isomerase family mycothiol-dependent enzyme [Kibdelosporangium aridum]|uniref:maleylpyruvate isomerase family mycothiol-dependent enzyme n=1 Tax=Kibdelosporangium aridum TaxID=2030 RepID=UPI000527B32F